MKIPPEIFDILKVAAPTLATALGSPLAGAAATVVVSALSKYLAPETVNSPMSARPGEIVSTIEKNISDPEFVLRLKIAEIDLVKYQDDLGFKFADLAVKQEKQLQDFQVASGAAPRLVTWGMSLVVLSLFSLFSVVIGSMLLIAGFVTIPTETVQMAVGVFGLIGTIVGYIAGFGNQIVNFYWGSSKSSEDKSAAIQSALQASGAQLGEAAATASRAAEVAAAKPVQTPQVVVVPTTPTAAVVMPAAPAGPSRFIDLVEKILDHEGGYSDHPQDPGKCTNYGITIGTLGDWRGSAVTCETVKALTKDQAKEIYFAKYWNALSCDAMPPGVDYMVFDFGVNGGISRSARILQTVLAKRDPSLKVDGVVGPLTIAAIAKASNRAIVDEFHEEKMRFYRGLNTWATFGSGWTRRADETLADAKAMVAASTI